MKIRTIVILVIVAAAAITFAQWCYVMAWDNFDGIIVETSSYKVFRYGFPFKIVVTGAPGLSTPEWQTPWRVAANFASLSLAGLLAALVIRTIRSSFTQDLTRSLHSTPR